MARKSKINITDKKKGKSHHCFTCQRPAGLNCRKKGHVNECVTHSSYFHKWSHCRGCTEEAKHKERKERKDVRRKKGSKGSRTDGISTQKD
ncbi:hypothetical protein N7486_007365 [Penicillium sp. IBT 16267x]|nr:hypothetical protein N7486_007365 [Penicillium sp. IBT 16267x]